MNHSNVYLVVIFIVIVAFTGCPDNNNQNSENQLIGTWEEAVSYSNQDEPRFENNCYPEVPDGGFDGTWLFENDGSYQYDFAFGSIAGSRYGHSYGTYDLMSDSILLLDVTYYEYQDSVYNVDSIFTAGEDTHLITITDTTFIDHHTICNVYWRKVR